MAIASGAYDSLDTLVRHNTPTPPATATPAPASTIDAPPAPRTAVAPVLQPTEFGPPAAAAAAAPVSSSPIQPIGPAPGPITATPPTGTTKADTGITKTGGPMLPHALTQPCDNSVGSTTGGRTATQGATAAGATAGGSAGVCCNQPTISGAYLVTPDDQIAINIYTSASPLQVQVTARIAMLDGTIKMLQQQFVPTDSTRGRNNFTIQLFDGYLVSVTVSTPTVGVLRGQVWVQLGISRATFDTSAFTWLLLQDYVYSGRALAWPGGGITSSLDGQGFINHLTALPGGGSVQLASIQRARWRVISVSGRFTTDGTAGNRQVKVLIQTGNDTVWEALAPAAQGPGQQILYAAGPAASTGSAGLTGTVMSIPIPGNYYLSGAAQTVTLVANQSIGADAWDLGAAIVEEWIEPRL